MGEEVEEAPVHVPAVSQPAAVVPLPPLPSQAARQQPSAKLLLPPSPLPLAPPPPPPPPAPSVMPTNTTTTKKWNTDNLSLRLGADVAAAGAAGVLVAPIITAIDKGIIENASGRRKLGDSVRASLLEMGRSPGRFFGGRPFGLVFVRYYSTLFNPVFLESFCLFVKISQELEISVMNGGNCRMI